MNNSNNRSTDSPNPRKPAEPRDLSALEALPARVQIETFSHLNDLISAVSQRLTVGLDQVAAMQTETTDERRACLALDEELGRWTIALNELEMHLAIINKRNLPQIQPAQNAGISQRELLAALNAKEQRIRELEKQLGAGESQQPEPADTPFVNRIVLLTNGQGNFKFPLNRSIMTIGRAAQNDIHIPSRFISRFHARIVSDAQGSIIEDLDSSNGLRVNADRVRRKQLRSGDLINIGRTQLKFIDLMDGNSGEGNA
jgi:pSer/pThr/pTyr-binding forkhead associated (FHA) protein